MATCPKCKGEMDVMASVCPHCGYDFPLKQRVRPERPGIAYSAFADLSLVLAMVCLTVGAIGTFVGMIAALLSGNSRLAFAALPTFFILVALYVAFQRVSDMDQDLEWYMGHKSKQDSQMIGA